MIRIGNFIFHYRNGLFPLVYALLFFRWHPLFSNNYLAALLGFAIALAGQILRAVTIGLDYIRRGGKNRQVYADHLVTGGIFAHSRNPLYLGNFITILGVGIAANSLLFLSVAIPFFIFAYAAIIAAEENFLRKKFGKDFDDYCARVNRIVLNFSHIRQTLAGMEFSWKRLINKEYGSSFIWLAAVITATIKNVWLDYGYNSNRPIIWMLYFLLLVVTLAYAVARYLKKKGLLQEDATA
ncbi:MAG: isoprenylcysteine carboxylmethyltransferase family protein [Verrucomicrobiota bacterium]